MNKLLLSLSALLLTTALFANDPYVYVVDLSQVKEDKVYVELRTPKIKEKEITFYMPKIVPGTYAIADYGRMVSELKAYDKKGRELEVDRKDDNSWVIKKAKKVKRLTYWVEDTYDTEKQGPEIFQPAGTNIEDDKNFIINTSGFFGYFEGMKKQSFELNFIREKDFYGATGLQASAQQPAVSDFLIESATNFNDVAVDQFEVSDYDRLIDSPLMYSEPDTAVIKVANTDVLIASYSPNEKITAKEIAASIEEVLLAQNKYLGGQLPVDKYAFIFYFTDLPVLSYGALEHSYSSLYYMPEATIEDMNQQLRDFAAHEFFHIVTPLNIHSEEIGSFDFNNPKMSRHLWMYEGITEFFAGSVQVKYGLITPEEYLAMLEEKLLISQQFKDNLPFTELSLGALDEYEDQYYNVYQKGALIGVALDIHLRELSDGAYGVQNMMAELAKKYGADVSFKDDVLFREITDMTYPEIGQFFETYVAGTQSLPYADIFKKVGVDYILNGKKKQYSFVLSQNNITVKNYKNEPKLTILDENKLDDMGKAMGLKSGDRLIKMNGETIPGLGPDLQTFFGNQIQQLPELETMSFTVIRNVDGEEKEVVCSAPNRQIEVDVPLLLEFTENPTAEQLKLRKFWLEPRP
ncbi:MAG: peptidase M61 [Bacteroidota bacterium]